MNRRAQIGTCIPVAGHLLFPDPSRSHYPGGRSGLAAAHLASRCPRQAGFGQEPQIGLPAARTSR
jgi:hypothetical protein